MNIPSVSFRLGRRHGRASWVGLCAAAVVAVLGGGCGDEPRHRAESAAPTDQQVEAGAPVVADPAPAPASDGRPRLVILGDSLTAGLGLDLRDAYPTRLQEKLDASGIPMQVVNAGISGDTSAGGLSRVDRALEGDVRVMVVALGGNDALRALPPAAMQRNLAQIIERAQARGVVVVLAGMEAPPNFGRDYTVSFRQVFTTLAKQYDVVLLPFLLEGVAGVERFNQPDGIHPTAEGARMIADRLWPVLEPLARKAAAAPGKAPRG